MPSPAVRRILLGAQAEKWGVLPGVAGSYFSTPDSVVNQITGDIDVRVKAVAADWTPTTDKIVVAKDNGAAQRDVILFLRGSSARLEFWTSANGSAFRVAAATAAIPFADGTVGWVRATRQASTGNTNFYTSQDGVTWTQLGTADVTTTVGAINAGSASVTVGILGDLTSGPFNGKIYRAQIYNGINGTLAVDFNPSSYKGANRWLSDTGEIWTINGSASVTSAS